MSTEEKSIYMLVEPNFITPFWFSQSIHGLEDLAQKHKTNAITIEDVSAVPEGTVSIVVVGTNRTWISETLVKVRKARLKPILIGAIPSRYGEDVSGTMYGGRTSIEDMVRYFHAHGRNRIALVDINMNSSNDVTKYETFLAISKQLDMNISFRDVYFRENQSSNSTEVFLKRIGEYDGVIGGNDYVAAYVLSYAREHGIAVPNKLFVAGLGDIMLCRYTSPSLTSATRSYYEAGQQVFHIWRTLNQNPDVVSIVTTMQSIIKPRGSTGNLPMVYPNEAEEVKDYGEYSASTHVVQKGTETIKAIQDCLSQCDYLDMKIISGVMKGESNESLAENLSMALGTINYRLKKLYKNAGVSTKGEFAELFKRHISVDKLTTGF